MQIRYAQLEDIAVVHALEQACFPDPWSQKSLRNTQQEASCILLLAEISGQAAGYLCASCLLDECELNRICILPQFRRQGCGRQLLNALIAACADRKITQIFLEVRASNTAARTLYQSMGFAELGKRPRYYQNPEEPAILMCRSSAQTSS